MKLNKILVLTISLFFSLIAKGAVNPITVNLQAGATTSLLQDETGEANYIVNLNAKVPGSLSLSFLGGMPTGVNMVTSGSSPCSGLPLCGTTFSLNPGGSCCLAFTLNGSAMRVANNLLIPMVGTIPSTYRGKAAVHTVTVSASETLASISVTPTTLSFFTNSPTAQTVTVTNTSLVPVENLQVTIPNGSQITIDTNPSITTCTSTLAANGSCNFGLLAGSQTEINTEVTISGANISVSKVVAININAPGTTSISISPSSSTPQILIANGTTPLVFTITNTGALPALNIIGNQTGTTWTGVNITASSGCANLAPGTNDCTMTLTSSTPNLAKQFTVQGDNTGTSISSPYVAFSTHGGLVFSVTGTSPNAIAKVVSETDNNGGIQWYNGTISVTSAQSITDGFYNNPATGNPDTNGNTYIITHAITFGLPNNPATYAAAVCYNNTSSSASNGDWYLPAICELGTFDAPVGGEDAGCGSTIPNIESNLFNLGFLSNLTTAVSYWSSTEYSGFPLDGAWAQSFFSVGRGTQAGTGKSNSLGIRCVRAFTY